MNSKLGVMPHISGLHLVMKFCTPNYTQNGSTYRIYFIFPFYQSLNVTPVSAPLSPDWKSISSRSLHHSLGKSAPKNRWKANFCKDIFKGFEARGTQGHFLGPNFGFPTHKPHSGCGKNSPPQRNF